MPIVERVRSSCADMPGATLDHPFGDEVDVFRVGDKMFALLGEQSVTLKCTPEESEALRAQHDWIRPGYHMNKRHWITVDLDDRCDPIEIDELIEESHRLVIAGLPKRRRPTADSDQA